MEGNEFVFDQITSKNEDILCPITNIMTEENLIELANEYSIKWNISESKLADKFYKLRNTISDYEIHCYIIPEGFSDFAHVTEIFERINRGGVEVKISDVVVTRLVGCAWREFKNNFDQFISKLIEEGYITEAEKYRSGVLQIFSSIAEPKDPRLESLLRKKTSEIKNIWNRACKNDFRGY
ncbi:hypothetical protein [Archaeoglobus profundus]|uniref:hypothetical protein n=1 Tax=Archaeoglobus profundus TaxID=84156 RepID=UPI0011D0B736|nr:hypothetical protein [Archaeoglobus profundus]